MHKYYCIYSAVGCCWWLHLLFLPLWCIFVKFKKNALLYGPKMSVCVSFIGNMFVIDYHVPWTNKGFVAPFALL